MDINITIVDGKIACEYGSLEYSLDDDKTAAVMSINVYAKRNRIGTALLQTFENRVLSEGCKQVYVPVSLSSEAISFWLSSGYQLSNKADKRKMNKILSSDSYSSRDDLQGVIEMEKHLN